MLPCVLSALFDRSARQVVLNNSQICVFFVRHAHVQLRKTEPAPLECSELPFPVSHVRLSLLANAVVPQLVRNCCTGNILCCSGMSLLSFWLLWLLLLVLIGHNSSWACWWQPSRWLVDIS